MNPQSMLNLVTKFTNKYGVPITWEEVSPAERNAVGAVIAGASSITHNAKVLLLKEKYNPLNPSNFSIGIGGDFTRYILALPKIDLKKDMIVTDNHGMKWKLGIVDWFDVGGVSVAKQVSITEVM